MIGQISSITYSLCDWCAELSGRNPRMPLGTKFLACIRWRLVVRRSQKSVCYGQAVVYEEVGTTHIYTHSKLDHSADPSILSAKSITSKVCCFDPYRSHRWGAQSRFYLATELINDVLVMFSWVGLSHINFLNPILRLAPFMESNAGQTEIGCQFLSLA